MFHSNNLSNMNENQNCVKKLLDTFQNKQNTKHFMKFVIIFNAFACCMFYDLNSMFILFQFKCSIII